MASADYEEKSSGGILTGTGCTWKEAEWTYNFPKELFTQKTVRG